MLQLGNSKGGFMKLWPTREERIKIASTAFMLFMLVIMLCKDWLIK